MRKNLGKFRNRITVYNITRVDDGGGGFTRFDPSDVTEFVSVWADITPIRDLERFRGQQLEQTVTHKINVRYNSGFLQGQILQYDGRYFYIETVTDPTQLKEFMVLKCREEISINLPVLDPYIADEFSFALADENGKILVNIQ